MVGMFMAAGNTQGSAKPAAVQFPQEKEAVAWSAGSRGVLEIHHPCV